jgi:hypothetical protein
MKLLGFLQNTGKETEFDPETLAREIINDDTNRHEKWWCRVMIYIYSLFRDYVKYDDIR